MRILFFETFENGYRAFYAVSQDVAYKGKMHEEILWCEMKILDDKIEIRWEDSWNKPEFLPLDIPKAQNYVKSVFQKHTGHENGRAYNID